MSEDKQLKEFVAQVHSEVLDNSKGDEEGAGGFKESLFAQYMIDQLGEYGVITGAEVCHCEKQTPKGNIKVSAWATEPERGVAEIFVCVYGGEGSLWKVPRKQLDDAFAQGRRLVKLARNGYHKRMEFAAEEYGMFRDLHETRSDIDHVRLFVLTDGLASETRRDDELIDDVTFSHETWDLQRVYRCVASGLPYEPIEVDFSERLGAPLQCLAMNHSMDDYTAHLAIMPGQLLYELYEEYGPRLLELNVRSFLQARGKVNKGIRKTLKEEPERFLAYNNGICCTAEHIEWAAGSNGDKAIASIRGLQVVNGGQTMASIHRAKREDGVDLASVYVQAKITIVDPARLEEIVPYITRYANSQNKVNEADFSSNDPFHVELERISHRTWAPGEQSRWFYERARGQYQVAKSKSGRPGTAAYRKFEETCPPRQKIAKTDAGKYINAWARLPHLVSLGPQKNFAHFITRLRAEHDRDWLPDTDYYKQLIGKAILYKTLEKLLRSMTDEIPAYRPNVAAYTVSYLAYRTVDRIDFIEIWNQQQVPASVMDTITSWCTDIYNAIMESAGQRNIGEWCKKPDCWDAIRGLNLEIPDVLLSELEADQPLPTVGAAARSGKVKLTPEDRENIAKVMKIDGEKWFRIQLWGATSGALEKKQCGIAMTLSQFASDGWRDVPSGKQAWHGVDMMESAVENMPRDELQQELAELVS